MRIIPVLDLMGGLVVRGIGGRREEYRPIASRLTASARPLDVAAAFRDHFGFTDLYLADLDAISGQPPALGVYAALRAHKFGLWVDAGLRHAADGHVLAEAGVKGIVAGLETLSGPAALAELVQGVGGERVLFSLDLRAGQPLGDRSAWEALDTAALAGRAIACGVRRLIVLDLARVGVRGGTGTEVLCRDVTTKYPGVELVAGGGVRHVADLECLRHSGVAAVLVASALHDGQLSRADLQEFV